MKLRPYQIEAVESVAKEWRDVRSTLVCLPTGTGKTVAFSEIVKRCFPRRALVLGHRQELIYQAAEKLQTITGWQVGIEMGELRADLDCMFGGPRVVVSSIQTQASGGDGSGRMTRFDPRLFGVIVCDESHHSVSNQWRKVIDWYMQNPATKLLGVTATPDRADEEALGQVYETVAYDYEIQDAIADGWLVPVKQQLVQVAGLDFSKCRTTAGDLNGADLAEVMEYEENLHKVVSPSIEIIGRKRTLVFASSVAHAERMAEIFNRHRPGSAAFVSGKTPKDDRKHILRDFASGRLQIVCNCAVLTEGFDNPAVEVIIQARPTKSRSLYAQMSGRSLRPAESIAHELNDHGSADARRALIDASEKPDALIVDFVGNAGRHKLVTSVDILGGKVSERAREIATKRIQEAPGQDVSDAIAEAVKAEEEEKRRAAAKRLRLAAKAEWTAKHIDPFDTFQIAATPERGWDKGKKLTEKQANLLRRQGIDPDQMTYSQGRQILNELFKRWDSGMATFGQCKILRKRGLPTNVTKVEASRIIDEIAKREGWKSNKKG